MTTSTFNYDAMKHRQSSMIGRDDQLSARYFRMRLKMDEPGEHIEKEIVPPAAGRWTTHNATVIHDNAPANRYQYKPRKCIYCGAKEFTPGSGDPLSDEHIISEAMGARVVLEEASCRACAKATATIEGAVLRSLLWAPRRHLKIRGKKRKRDDSLLPVKAIVDGVETTLHLPLEHHPVVAVLPSFRPPGLIETRRASKPGLCGFWAMTFKDLLEMSKKDTRLYETISPEIDTVRFAQLLAKIAHGYAVAELGLSNFRPVLPKFIRANFEREDAYTDFYRFIGGVPGRFKPDDALHIIGWRPQTINNRRYLVVDLRLFAMLGTPLYTIIIGEAVTPAQIGRVRAALKARERSSYSTP